MLVLLVGGPVEKWLVRRFGSPADDDEEDLRL